MAFNIGMESSSKQPILEPAWISGDFNVPEPVVVANGIVFAISNGEDVRQTREGGIIDYGKLTILTDEERRNNPNRAVLHALDAKTGKVLYESGTAIDTWMHFGGLAVADGRVYTVDHASLVYSFGLKGK